MIRRTAGVFLAMAALLIGAAEVGAAPEPASARVSSPGEAQEQAHERGERVDAVAHVADSRILEIPWPNRDLMKEVHLPSLGAFTIAGITIEMAVTKHLVFLWLAGLVLIVLTASAARQARRGGPPHGLWNLIEVFAVFIRDEVAIPSLGERYGRMLLPYLLTVFFFILTCNLFGLVPYGSTATGNISVTAGLATLSFVLIQAVAIKEAGFFGWLKELTGGVPWFLWPIMIPVEVLGMFAKPFALCVRLFANMTAGHIVILSLLGLIFLFHNAAVAGMSVPFSLFLALLEILISLIQAYIFTILTAIFTGLGVHAIHPEDEAA